MTIQSKLNLNSCEISPECSICFEIERMVKLKICNHSVCYKCRKKVDKCPLCRVNLNKSLSKSKIIEINNEIAAAFELLNFDTINICKQLKYELRVLYIAVCDVISLLSKTCVDYSKYNEKLNGDYNILQEINMTVGEHLAKHLDLDI
eukprot:Lithocolla_globosa_v1_NODE_5201_length_1284_cov_5.218063.p1 type:complete len:148 gc:universal NODE_5201_length_1284_cov_5.218063:1105-662(-)